MEQLSLDSENAPEEDDISNLSPIPKVSRSLCFAGSYNYLESTNTTNTPSRINPRPGSERRYQRNTELGYARIGRKD